MSEHVYKSIELTGSSKTSSDDAIRTAIEHASKTVRRRYSCGATSSCKKYICAFHVLK